MLIAALSGTEAAALITGMLGICAAMVGGTYAVLTRRSDKAKVTLTGANPLNDKSGDLAATFWLQRFASLERGQTIILLAHGIGLLLSTFALIVDRGVFASMLKISSGLDEHNRRRRR